MKSLITFVLIFSSTISFADSLEVKRKAKIYSAPKSGAKVLKRIRKGKLLQSDGEEGGFYKLQSKSGREYWIRKRDVSNLDQDVGDDLVESSRSRVEDRYPKFLFEFGGSTGSRAGESFFELNAGVNTFFIEYLSWKNAFFYRIASGQDSFYGLDTSLRGNYTAHIGESSRFGVFGGGGYRIATKGQSAPFLEAGVGLKAGPIDLGVGVKHLLYSIVQEGASNETIFSLILSGGGSFTL